MDQNISDRDKSLLFWASFLALLAAGVGFVFRVMVLGTWQDEYWKLQETRNMAGITTIALAQDHQNQSRAHVWLGVNDVEIAKEIIDTEKMKTAMEKAGVIGNPSFSWWKPLE